MVADIDGAKPALISKVRELYAKYTGFKPEEAL